MRALWLVLALASGCEDKRSLPTRPEGEKAASAPAAGSVSPPGGWGRGDEPSLPEGARTVIDVGRCTEDCVEKNGMRAEAPDKIEADCRARCRESCEEHCDSGSEASKAACRAECVD